MSQELSDTIVVENPDGTISVVTVVGGAPGPVGPTGSPGVAGVAGAAGVAGVDGPAGAPGSAGVAGATGPAGAQGSTGAASTVPGPAGSIGLTGPAGSTGAASTVPGPAGSVGATGAAGSTGAQGATGAASVVPGPAGAQGIQGTIGATGADSVVPGPTGTTGATGGQGVIGVTGPQGVKGDTGTAGTTGAQGPIGLTPTTMPESGVVGLVADLALKAPLASPALTGTPTAPTAAPGTNTTQLATTAFAAAAVAAVPVPPFTESQITGLVADLAAKATTVALTTGLSASIPESQVTGLVADLLAHSTAIALRAPLASPTFSGPITLSTAVSQIVPGSTSLSIRNNANTLDNLLVTDAGVVTARAGLTLTGGPFQFGTDTILVRDAANTLAMRNGTTAQTFRIYNTFTDASNYERLNINWIANTVVFQTDQAGTGISRPFQFSTLGNAGISFATQSIVRWAIGPTSQGGALTTGTDALSDIGFPSSGRPRNIYQAGGTFQSYNPGAGIANDGTNWERADLTWAANTMYFRTAFGGAGVTRSLVLGGASILFEAAGAQRWYMDTSAGHFRTIANNATDIGGGGQSPRNIYVAGAIVNRTKAGTPVDGDFTNPADGMTCLDTTNGRWYCRTGGAWKSALLA